ncbi:MAG: DEAD/DEAH box helicase family protein [Thermoflexales bacterium]|nr:DEAD/DEAH box helicase family protein [Thermoflexales bacterium]
MAEAPYAYFLGGTLVLNGVDRQAAPPPPFRWLNAKWRCPAVHYRAIRSWLVQQGVRNTIPRWHELALTLYDEREAHSYQREALAAWLASGRWGSVVLPTGAGKTFLALQAIAHTAASTLVVVPTVDLLHQWYARLENAFRLPIGVWYGLEKQAKPITVTTYPSAWAHAEALGHEFKLIIFDEIHHLPAPTWHEIALMYAAPCRLGLTATYPEPNDLWRQNEPDPVALLDELVGPVVYTKRIDELSGEQLANYRTQRIRVELTREERAAYDAAHATYIGYVREARLRESHGPRWWDEFTRRSARDAKARQAKVAEIKLKEIVHQAQGKLEILGHLLREHRDQQMLIFTAHNRFAYQVARRHLVPIITHQTTAAERKAVLDKFRAGEYRAIVTSKVLNEGIDVPEAKVAVVLGGSASAREYVQRLGRVLRKRGNQQAVLYEVIARGTVDEGIAQRRRPMGSPTPQL